MPETVPATAVWRQGLRLRPLAIPGVVRRQFWSTAAALVAAFSLLGFLTALTGAVVGVTLRAGIGRVLERCPPAQRGQLSSALFVAVYAGASVPTIAAGLVATRFGLTAAVLGVGAFVIALAAVATAISLRAARISRS